MRPLIFDYLFNDDRMFVLELSKTISESNGMVVIEHSQTTSNQITVKK
jgi:hypothetical protein